MRLSAGAMILTFPLVVSACAWTGTTEPSASDPVVSQSESAVTQMPSEQESTVATPTAKPSQEATPTQTPATAASPTAAASATSTMAAPEDFWEVPPPPGAYPVTGIGVPPDAVPLLEQDDPSVVRSIKAPVGEVFCGILEDQPDIFGVGCGSQGIIDSKIHGVNENGDPYWMVIVDHNNPPRLADMSDTQPWQNFPEGVTEMKIGDVRTVRHYVFAATDAGLTVWSAHTGQGAFIDGKEIKIFKRKY